MFVCGEARPDLSGALFLYGYLVVFYFLEGNKAIQKKAGTEGGIWRPNNDLK